MCGGLGGEGSEMRLGLAIHAHPSPLNNLIIFFSFSGVNYFFLFQLLIAFFSFLILFFPFCLSLFEKSNISYYIRMSHRWIVYVPGLYSFRFSLFSFTNPFHFGFIYFLFNFSGFSRHRWTSWDTCV